MLCIHFKQTICLFFLGGVIINSILSKIKESALSILPIYFFVIVLCCTPIVSLSLYEIVVFSIASIILIVSMAYFNLGANIAMTPMGKVTGAGLTKQGKIIILLLFGFLLGFLITVAEPDLSVLASQTKAIFNSSLLIYGIGVGVGIFLLFAILRIIFKINLTQIIAFSYMILFAVGLFALLMGKEDIIALAFDSGGVTTGPITVPFLMALGIGISSIIANKKDKDSSFGLIALCSVGPMVIVILLSLFSKGESTYELSDYSLSDNIIRTFGMCFVEKMKDVAIALGLIVFCFLLCNFIFLKISYKRLKQIGFGVLYTYLGLVLFLTSVEVCYMSIGYKIGVQIASYSNSLLVVLGFVIGALTVLAEPAIHVLNEQVQEITGGLVRKKSMMIALTIGVGIAICLSMLRIVLKFNVLYYLIPGYILSIGLSFFVPKIYSAIAFDSGGVASGPLTSSFILPLAVGACFTINGLDSILINAFGVVSLVAMTPIITIQCVGLIAIIKDRIRSKRAVKEALKQSDEIIIQFM